MSHSSEQRERRAGGSRKRARNRGERGCSHFIVVCCNAAANWGAPFVVWGAPFLVVWGAPFLSWHLSESAEAQERSLCVYNKYKTVIRILEDIESLRVGSGHSTQRTGGRGGRETMDADMIRSGALGAAWGSVDHLLTATESETSKRDAERGGVSAVVLPSQGLRTIDMGHGRSRAAETVRLGDKMGIAAQANDLVKVQRLLRRGVSVNTRNSGSGVSPLGVAAERGHAEMVKVLLQAKAEVDAVTNDGLTPLHICCQFGQTAVVQLLLSASASVNTVASHLPVGYEDCSTPLMAAIMLNHLPTIELLLEARACPNTVPPRAGDNALHLASRRGRDSALELLLSSGEADVQLRNRFEETPLECALTSGMSLGHQNCVAQLRSIGGTTAETPFAQKGHTYVIEAMKRLSMAARREERRERPPNQQQQPPPPPPQQQQDDDERRRQLPEATAEATAEVTMASCDGGDAPIKFHTELLRAYLRSVAATGDVQAVKGVATAYPDLLDSADIHGRTALHAACEAGHLGVAAALIGRGAAVDVASAHDSRTPLHLAASNGHAFVVRLLLKHGASPTLADANGQTATQFAQGGAVAALAG